MGTIIVGAIVLGVIGLAVRSMARDKKNGKSPICGGTADIAADTAIRRCFCCRKSFMRKTENRMQCGFRKLR